ncbi:calcium-binding protein [Enterovibrio norvegicus]|uniref:calcium-binding protein n=1 Tax=Enterovibrio norvegicus TaxID=188144 RepID=UPI00354E8AFA
MSNNNQGLAGSSSTDEQTISHSESNTVEALYTLNEIVGTDSKDRIEGTDENDRIFGLRHSDRLYGHDGDDELYGGTHGDFLYGGAGNDKLYGDEDRPLFHETRNNDRLYGGDGNDELYGHFGDDELYGEDGDDIIFGGIEDDLLYGGQGNDSLVGGDGKDLLYGDEGNDSLVGGEGNDKLYGDEGNDYLSGGEGHDILDGEEGDDHIEGGDGDDWIDGREGNDVLKGGEGYDRIKGQGGNDVLDGQGGNNELLGHDGDDIIYGGTGNNLIDGGAGYDQAFGSFGNDTIRQSELAIGRGGNDIIDLSEHTADIGIGGAGDDWIEGYGGDQVSGGSGNDVLLTLGTNDTLHGGTGNDVLLAEGLSTGSSRFFGGEGDDFLAGNGANQLLIGGSGADTFFFGHALFQSTDTSTVTSPTLGADRIVDFEIGIDTISIDEDLAKDFDDLLIEQYGITTRITLSDDSIITLNNTQAQELSASDFVFTTVESYRDLLVDWQTHPACYWNYTTIDDPDIIEPINLPENSKLIGDDQDNILKSPYSHGRDLYLDGGAGDDILEFRDGNSTLVGGEGNDTFVISHYNHRYSDLRYNDTEIAKIEDFTLGEDTVKVIFNTPNVGGIDLSTINAEQIGSSAVFTLTDKFQLVLKNTDVSSISNDDIAFGVRGNGGDEKIYGNANDNSIWAGDGFDTLFGNAGNDTLYGNDNDELYGGAGDDLLVATKGNQTLTGGSGADTFDIGFSGNYVQNIRYHTTITDFETGIDSVNLTDIGYIRPKELLHQDGDDVILVANENSRITFKNAKVEDFPSDYINLTMTGSSEGWDGNDTMLGNSADNTMIGHGGEDRLEGRAGFDTLTGGEGADTFVVNDDRKKLPFLETDTITDFVIGEDKIAFDDSFYKDMDFNDFIVSQQGDDTLVQIIRKYTQYEVELIEEDVNVLLLGINAEDISANDFEFFYSGD